MSVEPKAKGAAPLAGGTRGAERALSGATWGAQEEKIRRHDSKGGRWVYPYTTPGDQNGIPVYYSTENGKHAIMALQRRTPSSRLRRLPPWRSSEGGYCATRNDLRVCVARGRKVSLTIHLTSEERQTLLTGASGRERVSKLDPS